MFEGINPLLSAEAPSLEKARAFARYCNSRVDANGQLQATNFKMSDIPKLAPYVVIMGVIEDGKDFQVRLAGTRLVSEFFGRDPTGSTFSQTLIDDDFGRRSWHIVREVLRTKRPVLNQPGRTRLQAKNYLNLETVNFPLFDESGAVIKIALIYDFLFEKQPSVAV